MQVTHEKKALPAVERVAEEIVAPILCDFVAWTMMTALEMGVKRLYFLARDGWIMRAIAEKIDEKFSLGLDLRYLYCSRTSLRLAALNELGDEKFRYLLEGGFALTPKMILCRLGLDEERRGEIYADIGYSADENSQLGKIPAAEFCEKLRNSRAYLTAVKETADSRYGPAALYLEQEGLLDDTPCAIVDSGWTGSMQKMLRLLTGKPQLGFYFGMYSPADPADGEFNAYLFDSGSSPRLVSRFNNHLFEAICGAPHGMTIGYEYSGGVARPVFNSEKSLNSDSPLIEIQRLEIFGYINEKFHFREFGDMRSRQKFAFPLLDKLMFKPDIEAAEAYGALRFSDDPAETCSFPLARRRENVSDLYLLPRAKNKLFGGKERSRSDYWGYGAAALNGKGAFCRANLRIWEALWLIKRKQIGKR